ncbi:MAG: hypothetical protein Q9188_006387 [Gyalolechia gomerana]
MDDVKAIPHTSSNAQAAYRSQFFEQSARWELQHNIMVDWHGRTSDLQKDLDVTSAFLQGLSLEQRQLFQSLIESNRQLVHANERMTDEFQRMRCAVQLQLEVPPQVPLQKPITLLDACGKVSAFHLDFINCSEAFLAILKIRFQEYGVGDRGIQMLDDSQFVLEDYKDNHLGLRTMHRERINEEDLNDLIDQFRRVQLVCPEPWKRHVSSQHLQRRVSHRSFGDRAGSSSPGANGVNGTAAGLRIEDARADLSSNPVLEASEVGTPRRGSMVDLSITTSLLERLTGVQHLNKSEPSNHRDLDDDRRSKMRREIEQWTHFTEVGAHVLDTRDLMNSVDPGESTSNSLRQARRRHFYESKNSPGGVVLIGEWIN